MIPKQPVLIQELFSEEHRRLLELLESLSPQDFEQASPCPGWTVQDLVAHLIGDDLGGLSGGRNRQSRAVFHGEWADLVIFINRQNEAWVEAMRRLSRVLIELLTFSRERIEEYLLSLDPMAPGPNVAWAGTGPMPMWMHIAREYTERWVHQTQIRESMGAPGLVERRPFHPVLDAFTYALPIAFNGVAAANGAHVLIRLTGDAGGDWSLVRVDTGWTLHDDLEATPVARIELEQDTAWRLWTKGLGVEDAGSRAILAGDAALCEPVLHAVAMIV